MKSVQIPTCHKFQLAKRKILALERNQLQFDFFHQHNLLLAMIFTLNRKLSESHIPHF